MRRRDRTTVPRRRRRHGRRTAAPALAACLVLLAGCAGAGEAGGDSAGDAAGQAGAAGEGRRDEAPDAWEEQVRGEEPEWVENVFPPPGSEAASVNEVQVTHTAVGVREGVRLVVDGVDVTAFSEPGRGVLAYDPNAERAPVELGSGTHRVTAVRVRLDEAGEPHEVTDRFGWTFTVL